MSSRHALGDAGVELVQHAHLLDVILFVIKVFSSLYAALEHGCPDAKVLFEGTTVFVFGAAVGVFRVRGSGVARSGGEMY